MNILLFLLGMTFSYAAPMLFTGLGGMLSERSAVVNIGIDGLMTLGAFTAATVCYFTGNVWLAFLVAGIVSMALSVFHAIGTVTCAGNQTVMGAAMNFFAPGLTLVLCKTIFDGSTATPTCNSFPGIFDAFITEDSPLAYINLKIPAVLALVAAVLVHLFLYKTKLGLHIRAVGEYPEASDNMGINVKGIKYLCVLLSGLFAGFGGAAMVLSVVSQFSPVIVVGQGFLALSAVMLGKWTPLGTYAGCLLFGFAQALVVLLGGTELSNYTLLLSTLPFVVILITLVIAGNSEDPKANAIPYVRDYR